MTEKNKTLLPFKIRITLISFLSFILIFNIWKVIFFYSYIEHFQGSILLYIKSFLIGLQGDACMAGILSAPIFLISQIPKIKFTKIIRRLYYSYLLIIYLIIGFLNVVDLEFFKELGSHINMQAHMYGFDSGGDDGEVWIQLWVSYPVFIYLFMMSFFSYLIYKIVKIFNSKKIEGDPKNEKLLSFILAIFLIITGSSGFQKNPFNPKKSFFNKSDIMANHLAVNSIQNYIYSLITKPSLKFYDDGKVSQTIKELQYINRIENTTEKINEGRINKENPNIVLIILESHTGIYCNYLNDNLEDNVSPFLDSLAIKSINFKNCYANGTRTAYGLGSILCSWPVIPGYPIIRHPIYQNKENNKATFASIMKKIDKQYNTIFMYGGNSTFDQMKPFVESNQFDEIIDHASDPFLKSFKYDNENEGVNPWGVFDHYLFDRYIQIMDKNSEESNPMFVTILSTTNHLPWIIPKEYRDEIPAYESKKKDFEMTKRTMTYVDKALENLFKNAKTKKWFDNTVFIITADHGVNIYKNHINDPRNARIPFLIYNSNLIDEEREKIVSQVDILPTLLDLIGEYNYFDEELFGSSGFRGGKGFAFRGNDNNIQWIENGFVYSDNLGFEFEEYYKMTDFDTNIIPADLLHDSLKKKCKSYAQDAFIKLNQED